MRLAHVQAVLLRFICCQSLTALDYLPMHSPDAPLRLHLLPFGCLDCLPESDLVRRSLHMTSLPPNSFFPSDFSHPYTQSAGQLKVFHAMHHMRRKIGQGCAGGRQLKPSRCRQLKLPSREEHLYLAFHCGAAGGAHALRQLGSACRAAADVAAGQEQDVSWVVQAQRALHLAGCAALRSAARGGW